MVTRNPGLARKLGFKGRDWFLPLVRLFVLKGSRVDQRQYVPTAVVQALGNTNKAFHLLTQWAQHNILVQLFCVLACLPHSFTLLSLDQVGSQSFFGRFGYWFQFGILAFLKADNLCQFLWLSLPHYMYVFLLATKTSLYAELIYVKYLD